MKHVIAFPDNIYQCGGYYDEDIPIEKCFRLEHLNPPPVFLMDKIFEHSTRPAQQFELFGEDDIFIKKLINYYNHLSVSRHVSPTSVAISIENCYLHRSVIYRPADDGLDVIHETFRSNDRAWTEHLPFDRSYPQVDEFMVDDKITYFYVGSVGSRNYGHWLVDDLARLKYLNTISLPCIVLIDSFDEQVDLIKRRSVEYFFKDIDVQIQFIKPESVIRFNKLHYVTPVSYHPVAKNAFAMNFVRSQVEKLVHTDLQRPSRIFVERDKDRYRRLINSKDIQNMLNKYGFVSLDPEKLDFLQQIYIFSSAEIIVGTMCAAMTNAIFAPSGTKVIHLAPNEWQEPFYWDLAANLNHKYIAIYGARKNIRAEPFLDDFIIDVSKLEQILSNFI